MVEIQPKIQPVSAPSFEIFHGDAREVLADLPENSVDSIVTDPPYEIGFMGKKWDSTGIAYDPEFWAQCLRVLKPGGHLLSFGACRTSHRITCAIEDSGFEIRDVLQWLFGSGFPKSKNISAAIDKSAGHPNRGQAIPTASRFQNATDISLKANRVPPYEAKTEEAKVWEGWGSGLKPAYEPITMARKPFKGTMVNNVLEHGVGGLNINDCRVPREIGDRTEYGRDSDLPDTGRVALGARKTTPYHPNEQGRWPANILVDENYQAALGEKGRYFYCSKASRKEREAGCGHLPGKSGAAAVERKEGSPGSKSGAAGAGRTAKQVKNYHPTVKPISLMRWLCRLITPPGGLILDPFTGSGTTGIAAVLEGFEFLGIEQSAEYIDIATARIRHVL